MSDVSRELSQSLAEQVAWRSQQPLKTPRLHLPLAEDTHATPTNVTDPNQKSNDSKDIVSSTSTPIL